MECKSSSLCIFDKPGTSTDIQRSYVVDYYPVSSVSSNGPIEFYIPGNAEDYIDVNDIKVYIKLKVTKGNGKDVEATDEVGLNNLPIATLFQDASLMLGETQIEGGHMNYPYYGYFNTVMQFQPDAQQSHLLAFGWYRDEAAKFDAAANEGFKKRSELIGSSATIEFEGPLYFDFFN